MGGCRKELNDPLRGLRFLTGKFLIIKKLARIFKNLARIFKNLASYCLPLHNIACGCELFVAVAKLVFLLHLSNHKFQYEVTAFYRM